MYLFLPQPNSERKPLEELNAMDDEDLIDQPVNPSKRTEESSTGNPGKCNVIQYWFCYIVLIVGPTSITEDDLEAELEADLNDLKLDDIDTTDVNLDDEELLEDQIGEILVMFVMIKGTLCDLHLNFYFIYLFMIDFM